MRTDVRSEIRTFSFSASSQNPRPDSVLADPSPPCRDFDSNPNRKPGEAMSGRLPQFVVAQLQNGHWAGFHLTPDGFERITLSRYSPVDAAVAMAEAISKMEDRL